MIFAIAKATAGGGSYNVALSIMEGQEDWGTVEGSGIYTQGDYAIIRAIPNEGYVFQK